MRHLEQVAATDATVLSSARPAPARSWSRARSTTASSRRRAGRWSRSTARPFPATLIESELFGHEKGAFTGATGRREGRFELADGGTIFLDEIGELPLDLQAKLLRVLQEGEFEPVGSAQDAQGRRARGRGDQPRSRRTWSTRGGFREDLYYRLNVFPIAVPPLRERGDDVILLAETFAGRFAQAHGA